MVRKGSVDTPIYGLEESALVDNRPLSDHITMHGWAILALVWMLSSLAVAINLNIGVALGLVAYLFMIVREVVHG